MRRFLLVDDEIQVLHALQRTLRQTFGQDELRVEIFTDPEAALLRCGEVDFDIVVSDYRMPGMNGVEFLRMVRAIQPDAVRLVLSASTEFDAVMSAINQAEVFRYITKPWQANEIKDVLQLALAHRDQVDGQRVKLGELTPQQIESRRLEADEPGITKVDWGPDRSIHLD